MEITIKSNNYKEEGISAFSYNLGKLIEEVIREETNNLKYNNQLLEAKMLQFRQYLLKEGPIFISEFDKIFGISTMRSGDIE